MKTSLILKSTALGLVAFAGAMGNGFAEAPKLKADEFQTKLKRDATPLPNSGQLQMSYADVVQKVLPAVVRITSFTKGQQALGGGGFGGLGGRGRGGLDGMPPEMLDQLRRYFGIPGNGNPFDPNGEDAEEEDGQSRPQQRRGPRDQKNGTGSGVVISADGYILTNNHVIADSTKLEVTVGSDPKAYPATVIGKDPNTDVALLKIERTGLPFAVVGDSSKLRVGDIVLAAGSPMELSQSVSQGIVSALGRTGMGITGYENFIQTDAAINMGNSGGPLFDAMGRIVGINTAIMSRSGMNGGIGFSIPVNMVLSVVEDLLDDGKVTRGFLGIQMEEVNEALVRRWNLDNSDGVQVKSIVPNSPAEKAGLEVGDVVTSAAGQPVDGPQALKSVVGATKPGVPMTFQIVRDGEKRSVNVTLTAVTDEQLRDPNFSLPGANGKPAPQKQVNSPTSLIEGVTAQDLTPGLRQRYDIPADVQGVVVSEVKPNSIAANSGLQEGDVIYNINLKPVKTLAEANAAAKVMGEDKSIVLRISRAGEKQPAIVLDFEK